MWPKWYPPRADETGLWYRQCVTFILRFLNFDQYTVYILRAHYLLMQCRRAWCSAGRECSSQSRSLTLNSERAVANNHKLCSWKKENVIISSQNMTQTFFCLSHFCFPVFSSTFYWQSTALLDSKAKEFSKYMPNRIETDPTNTTPKVKVRAALAAAGLKLVLNWMLAPWTCSPSDSHLSITK